MTPYRPAMLRLLDVLLVIANVTTENYVSQSPLLVVIAAKKNRPPYVLSNSLILLLFSLLLFNPNNVAPRLSDLLIFTPCFLSSLTYFAEDIQFRPQSETGRAQLRRLVDCWMVFGVLTLVESFVGLEAIGTVVPVWWISKVGLMGWVWAEAGGKGKARPKPLCLTPKQVASNITPNRRLTPSREPKQELSRFIPLVPPRQLPYPAPARPDINRTRGPPPQPVSSTTSNESGQVHSRNHAASAQIVDSDSTALAPMIALQLRRPQIERKKSTDSLYSDSDDESATLEEVEFVNIGQGGTREVKPKAVSPAPNGRIGESMRPPSSRLIRLREDEDDSTMLASLQDKSISSGGDQAVQPRVDRKDSDDVLVFDSPTPDSFGLKPTGPILYRSKGLPAYFHPDYLLSMEEIKAELK